MREIKFRAWNGIQMLTSNIGGWFVEFDGDIRHNIGNPTEGDSLTSRDVKLMQYTGLKDANGVEIYEGDILGAAVFNASIVNAQVGFANGCFILTPLQGERWSEDLCSQNESCSIIGNIYENPELIADSGKETK